MQKKIIYYFLIISLLVVVVSFSAQSEDKVSLDVQNKVEKVYLKELNDFLDRIKILKLHLNSSSLEQKKTLQEARNQFKKIEFLIGYEEIMGDEVSRDFRWINGANIITDEFDSLSSMPVLPHGLQTLEELIYEENTNQEALSEEVDFFINHVQYIVDRYTNVKPMNALEFHTFVWDAMRYGIIRMSSLGISGFDVPASFNMLPELESSLQGMQTFASFYEPYFKLKQASKDYKEGQNLFKKAIQFVEKEKDFDHFDRLVFLKSYLQPLSIWLQKSISTLGFDFPINTRAIQNNTSYIFDKNAFNISFFIAKPSKEKMFLGKKLFFDKNLSGNKNRNCASCHLQEKGLADGMVKNISLKTKEPLLRNTPSLWNVAFQSKFFYDARVQKLELQVLDVLQNEDEMQGNIQDILKYLKSDESYVSLFEDAYNGMINEFTLANALSDYLKSYISLNSRFDQYMRGETHAFLTDDEKAGFNLFMGKAQCGTCHFAPTFNGLIPPKYKNTESEIIGVPFSKQTPNLLDSDLGRYQFTRLELHKNAFKTTGIRNIEFTAPYMHNGVFETLEEVLDFYNNGGGAGHGMDLPSQTLSSDSLHLSKKEMQQIIAFMKSLSDTVHVDVLAY